MLLCIGICKRFKCTNTAHPLANFNPQHVTLYPQSQTPSSLLHIALTHPTPAHINMMDPSLLPINTFLTVSYLYISLFHIKQLVGQTKTSMPTTATCYHSCIHGFLFHLHHRTPIPSQQLHLQHIHYCLQHNHKPNKKVCQSLPPQHCCFHGSFIALVHLHISTHFPTVPLTKPWNFVTWKSHGFIKMFHVKHCSFNYVTRQMFHKENCCVCLAHVFLIVLNLAVLPITVLFIS